MKACLVFLANILFLAWEARFAASATQISVYRAANLAGKVVKLLILAVFLPSKKHFILQISAKARSLSQIYAIFFKL
jgi:hypothetical protein